MTPTEHEFYVLSKGNNSGRPSHHPHVNSFVVRAASADEKDHLYWLTYAAWKSRAFEPYLRGSVIAFITVSDFRRLLQERQRAVSPSLVGRAVAVLAQLDEREAAACRQLKAIVDMRHLLLRSLK